MINAEFDLLEETDQMEFLLFETDYLAEQVINDVAFILYNRDHFIVEVVCCVKTLNVFKITPIRNFEQLVPYVENINLELLYLS